MIVFAFFFSLVPLLLLLLAVVLVAYRYSSWTSLSDRCMYAVPDIGQGGAAYSTSQYHATVVIIFIL